jgi:Fe-S cluster assembly protein SufD
MPATRTRRRDGDAMSAQQRTINTAAKNTVAKNTAAETPAKTEAEISLAEAFAAARATLPGQGDVASRREEAFRRFEKVGLPHRRVEEWKYTNLRMLMREAKPLAPMPDAQAKQGAGAAGVVLGGVEARRVVFADGVFIPEFSDLAKLEPGLSITSLAQALSENEADVVARLAVVGPADGDVAAALNTAFMGDGAVIRIADGATITRPIHLVFARSSKETVAFTRSLVVVGKGAQVTLLESFEGPDDVDYQVNSELDLFIGDRAIVERVKVATDGSSALHIATLAAIVGADAEFNDFSFVTGGALTRNQLFVRAAGERSTIGLRGAALLKSRQHVDTTLVLDHAAVGCNSREMFKSVLDDDSQGVFQGKIVVKPGAQQTDARMMTNALLLSDDAEADNKPELEIFADDVQCGHGATAGALDDNLKFYLMARGIPEGEAESLLIQAFVGEAVDAIRRNDVREALMSAVVEWLRARA